MSHNNLPLHKRTHWRRVKEITTEIGNYEHINLTSYDFNSITCYTACGDSLMGTTVTYVNNSNESPWVSDNKYEIYEIPSKTNSDRYTFCGDFLFLAHDVSFDYWLFGTMTDKIDYSETKATKNLKEKAKYRCYGEYSISAGSTYTDTIINKNALGKNVTYGGHKFLNSQYDSFSERKKAYCRKTNSVVLSEILGKRSNNITNVVDKTAVKKYNKNQKKRK